jgi:ABC-2 type transport system permease protein
MTTQPNAISGSPLDSHVISPAVISEARLIYWSVRRELWENRSIYIAPLAVAVLFLFGFMISLIHLPAKMQVASALSPMQQQDAIQQPYIIAEGLIMATGFLVALFYCLDALYGERRDRSNLFWKSLPVSDVTTVLSKLSIPMVVIPLLTFAIAFFAQWIMLLLSTLILMGSGQSVATLWTQASFVPRSLGLFYHLVTSHGLWYAPIYGWLLLVSAWARRTPFLWAALPLLAIAFVEKIAFNTSYFANMLGQRLMGGPDGAFTAGGMSMSLTQLTPIRFLISPGLWIGLGIAAAFLYGAVRLRRSQGPI